MQNTLVGMGSHIKRIFGCQKMFKNMYDYYLNYGFDADDEISLFSEYIVNSFENKAVQHVFEDSGSKDLRPVVELYLDWKKSPSLVK